MVRRLFDTDLHTPPTYTSIYREKVRPAKALEHYRAALAQTPNDARVLRLMGQLYMKMNQIPEAVKYLELSYRLQPTMEVILMGARVRACVRICVVCVRQMLWYFSKQNNLLVF